jgi:hypothetical protein
MQAEGAAINFQSVAVVPLVDATDRLLGESQQTALFGRPTTDPVELDGEELVAFGDHQAGPIVPNVAERSIAQSRYGLDPIGLGCGVK